MLCIDDIHGIAVIWDIAPQRKDEKMKKEKSCGAVVFTQDSGSVSYVIIKSRTGTYGFPKGHVEGQESEIETARREVLEETGLRVELREGFRAEDSYTFRLGGEEIMKEVVYFLASFSEQTPVAQESELSGIYLLGYEDAISILQFDGARRILREANEFLTR